MSAAARDGAITRLVVARHGNTFAPGEVARRVGARTDLPLVARGLEQAAALGAALKARGLVPSRIYTSRLRRTIDTARAAQASMEIDIPQEPLALFDEIDYGPDENRPEPEVRARLGDALMAWDERAIVPDGWKVCPGELVRGWVSFARGIVADTPGSTVLVVTSNGTARFAPHITGDFEGFRLRHGLKLSTGAFSVFVHDGARWTCEAWNARPERRGHSLR